MPQFLARFHFHLDREFHSHTNHAGFLWCSDTMDAAFILGSDMHHSTSLWVFELGLLERGIRTLIYVGENDPLCNWTGESRWLAVLDWSRQDAYNNSGKAWIWCEGGSMGRS
jgi:carboxypeptidase C (cathepsin A)